MSDTSFVEVQAPSQSARFETQPFDAANLLTHGVDVAKCNWVEITPKNLQSLLLHHVTTASSCQSYGASIRNTTLSLAEEILGDGTGPSSRVHLDAGVGIFSFEHQLDGITHKMHLVNQRRGPVVGTNCGPAIWHNVVLFCEGTGAKDAMQDLFDKLIRNDAETKGNQFTIYRWNVRHAYWEHVAVKAARSIDSVVLPSVTKDKIITDLDKFLTVETYKFYVEHGIPYKRSFLFFGEPGAGKTSLIQALAGKYKRNLCIMQPTTDPKFNDDSLADAIKDAPSRSLIVLEDVDALFDKNRDSKTKLAITFSGLLNALDGIANPDGQVFILTTNFRENLDAALIRNGRVDLHVQFGHATAEQMEMIFRQFYPGASADKASSFRSALVGALGDRGVNMAALQHYFIMQRESSADEAISNVQGIIDDMKERQEGKDKEPVKDEEVDKGEVKKKAAKKGGKPSSGGKKASSSGGVHVYINAPSKAESDTSSDSDDQ